MSKDLNEEKWLGWLVAAVVVLSFAGVLYLDSVGRNAENRVNARLFLNYAQDTLNFVNCTGVKPAFNEYGESVVVGFCEHSTVAAYDFRIACLADSIKQQRNAPQVLQRCKYELYVKPASKIPETPVGNATMAAGGFLSL